MNRRLCIYGALNYRTGQVHYMAHARKNAEQFHEFQRQLLEAHSERRIVLVVDNASYHRTRKVLALLGDHADHVFVIWLPRYSPELNLIEGLWGYLKRSALNNYFFGDIDNLEAAIHDAFAELQTAPRDGARPRLPHPYGFTEDRLEHSHFKRSAYGACSALRSGLGGGSVRHLAQA